MHIDAVAFSDFRNFPTLSFSPAPTFNLVAGANAQGKTNLLEGLGVLILGRSFRGARTADLARWTSDRAVLCGELNRGETTRSLRRFLEPREGGAWAASGEGCAWARVIPFGWHDLAIVHGAPQARRDFLDGFAAKLYPAHGTAWRRYRQILARRNHLLQGQGFGGSVREQLEPWDEQLVRTGLELIERRLTALARLGREVAELYPELTGRGEVRLAYRSSIGEEPGEASFRRALTERFGEEVRRGVTLVGPHRDEVAVELDGHDLRNFGSRGQQRVMALALRLAERAPVTEAVGTAPILLLDDALSELDPAVQDRVLERVMDGAQVFLSTADADLADRCGGARWDVQAGQIAAAGVATGWSAR